MGNVPVTLRPPLWQRALLPVAVLLLAGLAVVAGVDRGGYWWPVAALAPLLGIAVAARARALRVEVHSEDLVLVNWFRTVRLRWRDVARCGHDDYGLWVRRTDGVELRASAFQHGHRALAFARQPAESAAARLEKIRKRRRAANR